MQNEEVKKVWRNGTCDWLHIPFDLINFGQLVAAGFVSQKQL